MSTAIMVNGCAGCPRRWVSVTEAHCPTCHRQFSTVRNFDAHRRDGRCVDPASLQNRAGSPPLHVVERSTGPVWVRPYGGVSDG